MTIILVFPRCGTSNLHNRCSLSIYLALYCTGPTFYPIIKHWHTNILKLWQTASSNYCHCNAPKVDKINFFDIYANTKIGFFDANHAQCCTIRWVCSYSSHLLCKRNAIIVSQQSCSNVLIFFCCQLWPIHCLMNNNESTFVWNLLRNPMPFHLRLCAFTAKCT